MLTIPKSGLYKICEGLYITCRLKGVWKTCVQTSYSLALESHPFLVRIFCLPNTFKANTS